MRLTSERDDVCSAPKCFPSERLDFAGGFDGNPSLSTISLNLLRTFSLTSAVEGYTILGIIFLQFRQIFPSRSIQL